MSVKHVVLKVDAVGRGSIEIDGEEIENVCGAKVHSSVGELTTVELTLVDVEVEAHVDVQGVTTMKDHFRRYGLTTDTGDKCPECTASREECLAGLGIDIVTGKCESLQP